jgi:hypothetical protein
VRINDNRYWISSQQTEVSRLQMAHPYRTPMQIESIDQPVDNRTLTRPIRTKNDYLQFVISFELIFEWLADGEF